MSNIFEKSNEIVSDIFDYFFHSLWQRPPVQPAGAVILVWFVALPLSGIYDASPSGSIIMIVILWTTWGFQKSSVHIEKLRDEIKKLSPERLEEMDKNQFF